MYSTPYSNKRHRSQPEKNPGKSIVETAGYIPAKNRIENMILAGQRLVDYRKSQFDFEDHDKIDETFSDPTRRPNYDLADATQDNYRLEAEKALRDAKKPVIDDSKKDPEKND